MKRWLLFCSALLSSLLVAASHIVGGEMLYEYLGPGANGALRYRITLRLFRDENCNPCAAMPNNVFIGIYNNDNFQQVRNSQTSEGYWDVPIKGGKTNIDLGLVPKCITNPPNLIYAVAEYEQEVELPLNTKGYTAAYQTCCRVDVMSNVFNTRNTGGGGGGGGTGSTYSCFIPGTSTLPNGETDSSPKFDLSISVICQNRPFQLPFGAKDPDGDSLVYSFCDAFGGGRAQGANNINPAAPQAGTPPRYETVPYINGYSSAQPMGDKVSINSRTGLVSGIAPPRGNYVICVCIDVYRRGRLISHHRKDFIINVDDCDLAGADLPAVSAFCDSLGVRFENLNPSPLNKTFLWTFGDGTTSTDATPFHTYKDTGVYKVKLIVNPGLDCSDSATTLAKVFPGFAPAFDVQGICVNKPSRFFDRTVPAYGKVISWSWNFGDDQTAADTSILQNPTYTYNRTGPKNVSLTVASDKGCVRTVENTDAITIIDKAVINLAFKDTLICRGDQLQLQASGDGVFTWTPDAGVANPGTPTPIVQPQQTTRYKVLLDNNGCLNTDSVQVRVVDAVTLAIGPDTTICLTDTARLRTAGDGLRFRWTPASTLSSDTAASPLAIPVATTTYTVNAFIGPSCPVAQKNITVSTVPYPVANAGPDTTICFRTSAQLNASIVASRFTWSPAGTLVNSNTLSPIAKPINSTRYVLTVFDNLGCPKPGRDTVLVNVLPKINASAGRDTAVVEGQTLRFNATGGVRYVWSPPTNLSATSIPNPTAVYNNGELDSIRYTVQVFNQQGCVDSASMTVRIFKTKPSVFVPSAFSPNGDGRNDVLRPIAAGIAEIRFFRIFNRWGQLVFQTTVNGAGWDGRIRNGEQGSNVYVWIVEAVDYTGKKYIDKGTVTLIK